MTHLEELTAIIVKAVDNCEHDIKWEPNIFFGACGKCCRTIAKERSFNLEDVLLALKDCKKNVRFARCIYEDFIFLYTDDEGTVKFYLNKPLSSQSPETISWLLTILKHD
jgi:hypothetical protein